MTRQTRVQKRFLTGTIQQPGGRPQNVRLNLDEIKNEDDLVTVTATTYGVEGKTFIMVDDDTAGAGVTITLPPAIDSADRIIHIKKLGTTGTVTVDGNASETIDGATTNALTTQYDSLSVVSDGSQWLIL